MAFIATGTCAWHWWEVALCRWFFGEDSKCRQMAWLSWGEFGLGEGRKTTTPVPPATPAPPGSYFD